MRRPVSIPVDFLAKSDVLATAYLAANVAVVLGAGVVAWHVGTVWAYVAAFILVGARGQACYVLQHELMHKLLFNRGATNDAVGVIISAILGTRFYIGRRIHMEHHRLVGRPGDPNEIYHNVDDRGPGWPVLRFFAFHLLGGRLIWMARGLLGALIPGRTNDGPVITIPAAKNKIDLLALLGTQLVVFVVISAVSSPLVYILLYVLPLSTLTAFFEALRSFSEHVLPGEPTGTQAEQYRRFFMDGSALELFFISQFDFHYHHVHHLYPNVVTFKVRRLHHWLIENDPEFSDRFDTRPGYVGTALSYTFNRPFPGAGAEYPRAT